MVILPEVINHLLDIVNLTTSKPIVRNMLMKKSNIYAGYRHPVQIISYAVWLYHRFILCFVILKNCLLLGKLLLLMKRSVSGVKYTAISTVSRSKNRGYLGDTWYLDKVFIKINGVLHYLWRAVEQDGDETDILV